jgi:tripartite-type tricarboxylate transporter receptor subunit TctC
MFTKSKRRAVVQSLGLILGLGLSTYASAAEYPDKPIKLVVNASAGGNADFSARLIGDKLSQALNQPVIVENRAGAGGNIGAQYVARSAPDGYTLLAANSSFASNVWLYKDLQFDPLKDFEPISLLTSTYFILAVPPASPVKTLQEYVEFARNNEITYASAGIGQGAHLGMELFQLQAGIKSVHVPYGGMAPSANALAGGVVDAALVTPPSALPYAEAGKLRLLAMTGPTRSPIYPDIPSIAEEGYPGYALNGWQGLLAPKGTPVEIVNLLSRELNKILALPEVNERLVAAGTEANSSTPEEFKQFLTDEVKQWGEVIERSGIEAN